MFLVYEYVITFDLEVHMFWHGQWTGASILFFMNRYVPILAYVVTLLEFISMSDEVRAISLQVEALQLVMILSEVCMLPLKMKIHKPCPNMTYVATVAICSSRLPMASYLYSI